MTYQKDDRTNTMILRISGADMLEDICIPPLSKKDSVIIVAEMGCAADVFLSAVEAVREKCAIILAVVSIPDRQNTTDQGDVAPKIEMLREKADSLILVQSEQLDFAAERLAELLCIAASGTVNLDAADLKTELDHPGPVHLGIGEASGKDRYDEAVTAAAHSDLTCTEIKNARNMVVGMTISPNADMADVTGVMEQLQASAHPSADIIFAIGIDEFLTDSAIRLVVLACNFEPEAANGSAQAQ